MEDYGRSYINQESQSEKNNKLIQNKSIFKIRYLLIILFILAIILIIKNIFFSDIKINNIKKNLQTIVIKKEIPKSKKLKELKIDEPKKSHSKYSFYDKLKDSDIKTNNKNDNIPEYLYTYMVQVTSYRSLKNAEIMLQKLLDLKLKAVIDKSNDWYRVSVGPIHDKRAGENIKYYLEKIGIEDSYLRQVSKELIVKNNK